MNDTKAKAEAQPAALAEFSDVSVRAQATGKGAAAAASRGSSVASGDTAASAGQDYARAEAEAALTEDAKALLADLRDLKADVQGAMARCLEQVCRLGAGQGQIKETVDDLYAQHFAALVRKGSLVETTVKKLVEMAIKLGVDKLAAVVGAFVLPKVL